MTVHIGLELMTSLDNASLITTPRGSWILTPTLPMFFRRRNIYATPCLMDTEKSHTDLAQPGT
jgi:hypothetical protein